MKLISLSVKNFRKIKSAEYHFDKHVNVLLGNNEAGKSTLIDSIIAGLFKDSSVNSKSFFEQNTPWVDAGEMQVKLTFLMPDGEYTLEKNFKQKITTLTDPQKRIFTGDKNVKNKILKFVKIKTEDIYEATGLIKDLDLSTATDSKKLSSELQKSASGGTSDRAASEILANISKQLLEMKLGLNGLSRNPGVLRSLQNQIAEKSNLLNILKTKWRMLEGSYKTKDESSIQLSKIKSEIIEFEAKIDKKLKYDEIQKEVVTTNRELDGCIRNIEDLNSIEARIKEIESFLSSLNLDTNKIQSINLQLSRAGENVTSIQADLEILRKEIEVKQTSLKEYSEQKSAAVIIAGIIFLFLGILLSLIMSQIIFGLAGFVFFIASLIIYAFPKSAEKTQLKAEISSLQTLEKQKNEQLNSEKTITQNTLSELNLRTESEFFELRSNYFSNLELIKQLVELKKTIAGLSEGDIYGNRTKLIQKQLELKQLIALKYKDVITSFEIVGIKKTIQILKTQEASLKDKQMEAKARLQVSEVSPDEINELEEEIEFLTKDYERAQIKLKTLEIAKETLTLAIKNAAIGASEFIKLEVEKYLPDLTGNNYLKVRVQDDFSLEVFSEQKGDFVDPSSCLSTGTINQIYFLARIAYFKLITEDSFPPIFLDDPFITFDNERLECCFNILRELSKDYQIFLMTTDTKYSKLGKLIKL